jgi:hypothetical protein
VVIPDEAERGGAREHGEGAFAVHSPLVGPDHESGGGDDRADPDELEQVWSPCLDQLLDSGLVGFGLGAQVSDPAGEVFTTQVGTRINPVVDSGVDAMEKLFGDGS